MARRTEPGDPGASPGQADPEPIPTGEPAAEAESVPTVLDQLGGVSGLIYSTVPIVVFVPVNAAWGLRAAIIAALVVAVAVFAIRLVRREPISPAISGLIGVAICTFIAYRVGDAKGYFLFGIWASLAYAAAFVASIVVRWPLIGVAWNLINGEGTGWRRHRPTLLAYDLATAFWALVFGARFLTQSSLYDNDATGWLAVTRIAMGWPLTAVAVAVTIYLVRRADRQEAVAPTGQA
ncbi:DUF3159 domain-containing protein [Gordonia sinesedis]